MAQDMHISLANTLTNIGLQFYLPNDMVHERHNETLLFGQHCAEDIQ